MSGTDLSGGCFADEPAVDELAVDQMQFKSQSAVVTAEDNATVRLCVDGEPVGAAKAPGLYKLVFVPLPI